MPIKNRIQIWSNLDIIENETILMSADPPGQASKMAYLHQKRLNIIQKGKMKVDILFQEGGRWKIVKI